MQGVLVVSSNTAIRKSLSAVLQDGRMVRDCRTLSECLHIAAAEKLDMIFVDDVFEDGTAEELVARLNALGYGFEMIPLLLVCDTIHTQPFRSYGVRYFLEKPFKVDAVQQVVQQVDEIARMSQAAMDFARESAVHGGGPESGSRGNRGGSEDSAVNVDVREVSQRFRRLMARLQSRQDLVRAFADSMQEQFDVDNVVVLLPATGKPVFEIVAGQVASEIRQQFFIPLDEPLVRSLVRLGEPVWVHECERLGRENTVTAIRYGERLNIQVLCPVLSRGRLRALVGLSRFHRYQNSLELVSLLRLFLTFFAEALENAELYENAATAGETYRGMIDALPMGALAVSVDGRITHLNPKAAEILATASDELVGQPVERAGSMLAHCAHTVLDTECDTDWQTVRIGGAPYRVGASRIEGGDESHEGVLVTVQEEIVEGAQQEAVAVENRAFDQKLWDDMTRAVAHNFKNSFVPVQTCAELLPQRYQEESFRDFFLQTVRENIGRINQWIDQLLSFSRLEEESDWANVSVNEIIGRVLDEVLGQFPETHLDCSKELSRNDTVRGCSAVLERMFREIFRNAVEAVQDVASPEMTVKSTEEDGLLTIEILDNGSGFNPEAGKDPLRPFSTGKLSGNLGLGLAYAHRAARLHNGELEFDREGENGQRTVVRIILPMVKVVTPKPKKAVVVDKKDAALSDGA